MATALLSSGLSGLISCGIRPEPQASATINTANLYFYYDDTQESDLTAAPDGYEPFYISHVGRHGARWMEKPQYDSILNPLLRAERAGILTDMGKEFLKKYQIFYQKTAHNWGQLTTKGQSQIRRITSRMYDRFPEVFEGKTRGTAIATVKRRVIRTMEIAADELKSRDMDLELELDASRDLLPILTPKDTSLNLRLHKSVREILEPSYQFFRDSIDLDKICGRLFLSTENLALDKIHYVNLLHTLMISQQCHEIPDTMLCKGIFTAQEDLAVGKAYGYRVFSFLGNLKDSESPFPAFSAHTLKDIVDKAGKDISDGQHQLRLRYTHDSAIMPMVTLLNIDGHGEEALGAWDCNRIFPLSKIPMAASVVFVFYRNMDKDILVKILLNETEATLPLKPVNEIYYHWEEFRDYCENLIEVSMPYIDSHTDNL